MGFSLLFYSMPDFWLAMMLLIVFSTRLGWFPSGGYSSPNAELSGIAHIVDVANHMVLPVITLTLAYVSEYYLVMRSSLLDVMGEEYITTVRAKGVREGQVLWGHAVRNAMLPTISVIALSFGFVIGGALVVEVVFSYPGLGLLTFDALDPRTSCCCRVVPLLQPGRAGLQPVGRSALQLVRSEGAGGMKMTTVEGTPHLRAAEPSAVARARHRLALGRFWAAYRGNWMGIAGLVDPGIFVFVAIFAPLLADRSGLDVTKVDGPSLAPPSWEYPLGTDDLGRSVLTLVIWGTRISLLVGLLAAVVSMTVGSALGIIAGYRGGGWDAFLMRFTDWFLVLPFLPLAVIPWPRSSANRL